ncbi:MAG TPA: response regulator, partial [Ktedonobacterales bacterium]|nr:response regulator [Ktedonobacterales bacterium]
GLQGMDRFEGPFRPAPVLVVDEDAVIRDTLRTLLRSEGFVVAEATSEVDALEYLRGALMPHVVLLDFFLPLTNRGAVLHAAEHDDTLRQHCYLLVTATDTTGLSEEEQRLIRELCVQVIPKPVDAFAILKAVANAARQLAGHR